MPGMSWWIRTYGGGRFEAHENAPDQILRTALNGFPDPEINKKGPVTRSNQPEKRVVSQTWCWFRKNVQVYDSALSLCLKISLDSLCIATTRLYLQTCTAPYFLCPPAWKASRADTRWTCFLLSKGAIAYFLIIMPGSVFLMRECREWTGNNSWRAWLTTQINSSEKWIKRVQIQ